MFLVQHIIYVLLGLAFNFGLFHSSEPRVMPRHGSGVIQAQDDPDHAPILPDP